MLPFRKYRLRMIENRLSCDYLCLAPLCMQGTLCYYTVLHLCRRSGNDPCLFWRWVLHFGLASRKSKILGYKMLTNTLSDKQAKKENWIKFKLNVLENWEVSPQLCVKRKSLKVKTHKKKSNILKIQIPQNSKWMSQRSYITNIELSQRLNMF